MGGKPVEQKIKQDSIRIGENIRRIRLAQHIKQTQLVQLLQLENNIGYPFNKDIIQTQINAD